MDDVTKVCVNGFDPVRGLLLGKVVSIDIFLKIKKRILVYTRYHVIVKRAEETLINYIGPHERVVNSFGRKRCAVYCTVAMTETKKSLS